MFETILIFSTKENSPLLDRSLHNRVNLSSISSNKKITVNTVGYDV